LRGQLEEENHEPHEQKKPSKYKFVWFVVLIGFNCYCIRIGWNFCPDWGVWSNEVRQRGARQGGGA
jgi:hypothetical protein